MHAYLLVGLGSALGGIARHGASQLALRWWGDSFPWGTLVVNVTGSLLIGFLATLTGPDERWLMSSGARTFLMVGFCGGFTTFSAFSLQTLSLVKQSAWIAASANIAGSVGLCLVSVWLGHMLACAINR